MGTIDIFFQGENIPQFGTIEADPNRPIGEVCAEVIAKHGGGDAIVVFVEDADEPVDVVVTVAELSKKGPVKVHFHRCRHVEVSVSYGGQTASKRFGPGATIARIKLWAAVHEFRMTPGDAAEHLLQIKGTTDRPSSSTHVGSMVKCPHCAIVFDLIPHARVQG